MKNLMSFVGLGQKKDIKRKVEAGQKEQMSSQVKKLMGQKDQGLILMVKG